MTNTLLQLFKERRDEFEKLIPNTSVLGIVGITIDIQSFHKSEILAIIELIEKWAEGKMKSYEGLTKDIPEKKSYNSALSDLLQFLKEAKEGITKE